ncbi:hypothetical protein VQ01_08020 [Tamlana sp. s12]|nr:hypothetical protein VQ01_08020 [Tamlana sp. s12]
MVIVFTIEFSSPKTPSKIHPYDPLKGILVLVFNFAFGVKLWFVLSIFTNSKRKALSPRGDHRGVTPHKHATIISEKHPYQLR